MRVVDAVVGAVAARSVGVPGAAAAGVVGSAGDPSSSRIVYGIVVALAVIGVALVVVAVWVFRQTRIDPELLAPLETMSDRRWRKLDPASQRRMLDEERPEGAEPLHPATSAPAPDEEFAAGGRPVEGFDDLRSVPFDGDTWAPSAIGEPESIGEAGEAAVEVEGAASDAAAPDDATPGETPASVPGEDAVLVAADGTTSDEPVQDDAPAGDEVGVGASSDRDGPPVDDPAPGDDEEDSGDQAAGSDEPAERDERAESDERSESGELSGSDERSESGEPGEPSESAEPAESGEPSEAAETAESGEPSDTGESAESGEPARTER
jgi:hypothetical protein